MIRQSEYINGSLQLVFTTSRIEESQDIPKQLCWTFSNYMAIQGPDDSEKFQ